MKINKQIIASVLFFGMTTTSGIILASSSVSADDDTSVVDEINITVPVSCTLSGTGQTSHNATIGNGQYNSAIGETTMKAFCNDPEGFAIYAIGYTDDTDGKNVLTNSELGATHDIETGTLTSGANSQWAMKLSAIISPEPTYPITIQDNFTSFQEVPDDYTLVAKRTANTDLGTSAEGSTLKSTYQAYISPTQPAGTYAGQVKYVLVHPNYVDESALQDAITVIFDGNGLTFPDGSTTNTVKYANVCKPGEYGYVGNTYQEAMTSNISTGGTQNGAYTNSESYIHTYTLPNADKVKVVVEYAVTGDTAHMTIAEGTWAGWNNGGTPVGNYEDIYSESNIQEQQSFVFDGDTISIDIGSWGSPESGYDKGFYARIYPVYDTEQPNTTGEELPSGDCSFVAISGSYAETTEWHDRWTAIIEGQEVDIRLSDSHADETYEDYSNIEDKVKGFLIDNSDSIGTEIVLRAYNPITFDEVYTGAGKTKTNGYYVIQDLNAEMCDNVSPEEETTVIDVRDNNTYGIIKMYDGNCWLKDDLRLDPTNAIVAANMSELNTNASNAEIYNYLNGGNSGNVDGWTSVGVSSPDDWQPYNNITKPFISFSGSDYIGVYYNFCAATVGTFCYSNLANASWVASSDICPAGWRLPTSDEAYGLNSYRYYSYTLNPKASSIFHHSGSSRGGYYSPGNYSSETDYISNGSAAAYYWTALPYGIRYMSYGEVQTLNIANGVWNGENIRCIISTSD